MKHFLPKTILVLLAVFITTFSASAQSTTSEWTKAKAEKWFKSRVWANGMKLDIYAGIDKQEFARQYTANKKYWDEVFAYFREHDLPNAPVGKEVLDSGYVSVAVTDNPTKPFEQTNWESHRKNIDVQYVSVGAEGMDVAKVSAIKVTEPYNPAKDVAHYEAEGKIYDAKPGTIFIFFPNDAHRVNIKADDFTHDKKIVLKVSAAQ